MIKVIAYSNWLPPQEFVVETQEEANNLSKELKNEQYLVEIESIDEENDDD